MFKTTLFAIGTLAISSAAMAAVDGAAEFRIDTNMPFIMSYEADSAASSVTGQINSFGVGTVSLTQDRAGNWTGTYGVGGITANAPKLEADGTRSVEIQTMSGIFDFTIETQDNGDIEMRSMSPRGGLLTADLTDKGTQLSIGLGRFSVGVEEDSDNPGHYEGSAVLGFHSDTASLAAAGTLDVRTLAKRDPALFITLYVLPFAIRR